MGRMQSSGLAVLVTAILAGALLLAVPSAAQIIVSDLAVDMTLPPGSVQTSGFSVINVGQTVEYVRITFLDWWLDADERHHYFEPASLERSLYQYLSVSPVYFPLGPGESQDVRVTVALPESKGGTLWGMLLVESDPERAVEDGPSFGLQVHTRFGVKVYATAAGTETPVGRVTRISAQSGESETRFSVEFENSGNSKVVPVGWFEVRNVQGTALWRKEFEGRTVLPEARLTLTALYDGPVLMPGQYVLLGIVDYGASRMVGGQAVLTVE